MTWHTGFSLEISGTVTWGLDGAGCVLVAGNSGSMLHSAILP